MTSTSTVATRLSQWLRSAAMDLFHAVYVGLYGQCTSVMIFSHPEATGIHEKQLLPDVYYAAVCAICQRHGIRVFEGKSLQANGHTYVTNAGHISEGLAVVRYIGKYVRLYPKDPDVAIIVDDWLEYHRDFVHNMCQRHTRLCGGTDGGETFPNAGPFGNTEFAANLAILDAHLSKHSGWIGDLDHLSVADIVWMVSLRRLREDGLTGESDSYPSIRRYMQAANEEMDWFDEDPPPGNTDVPTDESDAAAIACETSASACETEDISEDSAKKWK